MIPHPAGLNGLAPGRPSNDRHDTNLLGAASQLQPEWHHAQMINGESYGLCIVPYQRLDSAEMGLVPGAITTPDAKRYMSFSWWLLD